jgi:branched-chain amino acid aminotransferase
MENFVWLNHDLLPLSQARVSVNDRGLLFGDGLFETLRADGGRVHFLKEHLERLQASAQTFRLPFPASIPWEERLGQLLFANALTQGPARLKILLSRGVASGLGLPSDCRPTLVIWAQAYTPPTPTEYAAGWPLVLFPEPRSTFMGRHKSLNYLFYLAARQYAEDHGAKEALICEADGLVSEGAATSLVYLHQGQFYTPEAKSALPGITLTVLRRGLITRGRTLKSRPTSISDLRAAQGLWLANSLMGLMPVAALDGTPLPLSDANPFLQECLGSQIST